MELQDILNVIKENPYQKEYIVITPQGKQKKRLFVCNDMVCELLPRCKRYGRYLYSNEYGEWISVEPYKTQPIDEVKKVKRFLTNVIKYLDASGAWADMKENFTKFLNIPDEDIAIAISSYENRREILKKYNIDTIFVDCLKRTASIGIKSINYDKYDREECRNRYKEMIANNQKFSKRWRNGYDNSFSGELGSDGEYRLWYSEEYKGCGNGHYYYALDERHAIFGEDD